ncbi:DUF4249 family protein [Terrimonas sp.]|uniref:DUF4249 family protein n=1 Tax=Terrimonas sp. TaxID=1914338 RepID=UPI00140248F9|nr:DUF4249 family protein [Terrimonas sp.]
MMRKILYIVMIIVAQFQLVSCERDFDIKIQSNKPMLIVEGYINNEMKEYNYVVLSRSQDYYSTTLENLPVYGAKVTVTEGTLQPDNSIAWDKDNAVILRERNIATINISSRTISNGIYFDERLITDTSNALLGKPGKYYLLRIEVDGNIYTAVTYLPVPVNLDRLSSENHFIDADKNEERAMITLHYKDPDSLGNAQLVYSRSDDNRNNFGWGGLRSGRFINATDDLINGQYLNVVVSADFAIKEKVDYYLVSVERSVYNFWNSFNKAKDNAGPFSTPVMLDNTITGDDVIGCFSGFSLSGKTIVVK